VIVGGLFKLTVYFTLLYTAPIVPAQNLILTEVNSTFVTLAMDTWLSGGCPVESFDVALQVMGDTVWHTVQNNVPGNIVSISSLLTVLLTPLCQRLTATDKRETIQRRQLNAVFN